MRIFTFMLSAALSATVAFSSYAGNVQSRGETTFSHKTRAVLSGIKSGQSGNKLEDFQGFGKLKELAKASKAHKSRGIAPRATAPDNTIVDEAPAGTASEWKRSSTGYGFSYWEGIFEYGDQNLAITMIDGEDGKIWLNTPLSQFTVPVYIYGTLKDNVLKIPGGQCIYKELADEEDPEGEWIYAYLIAMEWGEDEEGEWYFPAEDPDFRLVYENGEYRSENPDILLGLCAWSEEDGYGWIGYGDKDMVYAPQTEKNLEAPATIETEKWAMVNEVGGGHFVNVGTDGSKMYIQGLYESLPEAWVELDIDGEKAVMKSGQYLGADPDAWHYAYAHGATVEVVWDDDWEDYVDKLFPANALEFSYDAENKTLESDGAFVVSAQSDEIVLISAVESPRIEYQQRDPNTPPANPTDLTIFDFDEDYGCGSIEFQVPSTDVDGKLLDTKNLYYNLFVDGELMEFYDDEYASIPESPMVNVPWSFADDYDFFVSDVYHAVYYYFTGFETLGVQSVYYPNGIADADNVLRSEIVTEKVDGLAEVASDSKVVKGIRYFDLQGREAANPKEGLYIRSVTYSDGTVSNSKIIR